MDGDVARNPSWTVRERNDVATTLPLAVFTERNFVADFFPQKFDFTGKNSKIAFCATLWGRRGNVHGSSTGWAQKVISLVQCNVMYEKHHFFGPLCIWLVGKRVVVDY